MSLTIGWIDGGDVRGEFTESLARLAAYEAAKGRLASVVRIRSGPLLEEGRNRLVETMLRTPAEWFLFVDSDMVFDWDSAERLAETAESSNRDVVAGLTFGANDSIGQFPTIYKRVDGMPQVQRDVPKYPIEVDATGAAFLLVRSKVFKTYRRDEYHPWFHRRFVPSNGVHPGGWLGEDLSFCFWLRDKGVDIVVDPAVKVGHVKPMILDERNYRRGE